MDRGVWLCYDLPKGVPLMKLLKNRRLWISTAAGLIFAAAIYPYDHDLYIVKGFTYVCAVINLFSAAVFAILLYLKLEGKSPLENLGSVLVALLVQIPGHVLFAGINRGSWVCLGLIAVYLLYCRISWRRIHPMTKQQRKRCWAAFLILLVLGGAVLGYFSSPVLRVRMFLWQYQDMLEERIGAAGGDAGEVEGEFFSNPMPVLCGIKKFEVWQGQQDMVEFYLFAPVLDSPNGYYGVYYSFDDVPLPYQNGKQSLKQEGESEWSWHAEWDNFGSTRKLADHWYYFEAHF